MDYNLFWNAVGAIGATVGSFATAIAVIVAVVQYRQPYIKKAKIDCRLCYPVHLNKAIPHITINATNIGVRNIKIEMFYLLQHKKKYFISLVQSEIFPKVQVPFMLEPEEKISIYVKQDKLLSEINRLSKEGKWQKNNV